MAPIASTLIRASSPSASKDCFSCKKQTGEDVLGCDNCDRWIHLSCAKHSAEEVQRIKNWFCEDCEGNGRLTEWRRQRATSIQRMVKKKEYYEVDSIKGHRSRNDKLESLIEWKAIAGVKESTWEPEENLDGAIDLLQQYRRRENMPPSKIIGLLGANVSSGAKINRSKQ